MSQWSNTAETAATPVEHRSNRTGNGRADPPERPTEFQGPGFRFVRYFLLSILLMVGLLLTLVGALSRHMGMEVTVEAQGRIEPASRCLVKATLSGIIISVHAEQWQQVVEGDRLVTLDDSEWKAKLRKLDADLKVNQSRKAEIETRIRQDRAVLQAEVDRADAEIKTVTLQLEQVRKEYQLYYALYSPANGRPRAPIEDLLPIRLRQSVLQKAESDRERATRRLRAIAGREQEVQTLEKLREKLEQDRLLLIDRLTRTVIHAPVSGTVLTADLHRRVGDYLQAGETLLELSKLEGWRAEVGVHEIDLPRVKPGQPVRLYVNAFPHMEYKIFTGTVEETPAKPATESLQTGTPLYPVKVSIHDPEVRDGDRTYSLAYGMGVEARIVVDRGRIVDLLWRQLLRTAGKVVRHDFYLKDATESHGITQKIYRGGVSRGREDEP